MNGSYTSYYEEPLIVYYSLEILSKNVYHMKCYQKDTTIVSLKNKIWHSITESFKNALNF